VGGVQRRRTAIIGADGPSCIALTFGVGIADSAWSKHFD
jgi:hypothetical protein